METKPEKDSSLIPVLLVEDDEDDYIITRDLLSEIEGKRFALDWISDYETALKAIGGKHYEVVLVDYRLGEHTGLELLQAAILKGCKVPIILLTGQGEREIDIEAMKAGAADYLVKGQINAQLLERSIRYAIERQKAKEALQESEARFRQLAQQKELLNRLASQIRSTLDSKTILQTIVREVQALLDTDRVVIYQFTGDQQGEVVVESVSSEWIPILGKNYQDSCFPHEFAYSYQQGRVRAIDHVALSDLNECHKQLLLSMQVQANLVVPIRMEKLWGLLIAHECGSPRVWKNSEIELLQQLADQAAIAIQQAQLYEQSCSAAARATAQAHQLEQALFELKQTQLQLIQTEKMSSLGQLVAGVAHEINNPVSFIYGNLEYTSHAVQDLLELVQLYQQRYLAPDPVISAKAMVMDLEFLREDLPKSLHSMQVGADRIRQIVLSLRNFSRFEQAEMKPVDIHEGIDNTLLILQHRLQENGSTPRIQVIKEYGQLPWVECYAGQLNQVFMNILSNAIDALEEGIERGKSFNGTTALRSLEHEKQRIHPPLPVVNLPLPTIWIRTQLIAGNQIAIQIADNGIGMSEEVRKGVFDPFFTTKPPGSGTGLGLSISYRIVVDKHGGQLKCDSTPGQGSEFIIKLPLFQEEILTVDHPFPIPMKAAQ